MKFEDTATADQKIYSQTVPCGFSTIDMSILQDQDTLNAIAQVPSICL